MANAREILGRQKSIRDIMKITNAMYMISSSKMKRARTALANTEPYFYSMQDTLTKILDDSPEVGHKYFDKREEIPEKDRKRGFIVVTADKGLAGAYNHNVIKIAEKESLASENNMLFVVGQVGRNDFMKRRIPVDIDFKYTAQNPNMNRARIISEKMVELFNDKKLDEVYIIYTKMINSMTANVEMHRLLPLKHEPLTELNNGKYYDHISFFPSPQAVFDSIVPNYVAGFVYGALIESYCSEHNTRMMAMQSATESAQEMMHNLQMEYNRARQAAITQEITEVIGGAKAQKHKAD